MARFFKWMAKKGLLAKKGAAAIVIAAVLSLAVQPALTAAMTSPQCSDARASAMADTLTMADRERSADQSSCCNDSESSDQYECGNVCAIACASSTAADMPFSAVSIAAPAHPQHETDIKRPLLQFASAFIPPPPRT